MAALHAAELLQPLLDQLRDIRERELRSNQRLSDKLQPVGEPEFHDLRRHHRDPLHQVLNQVVG